MCYLSIGEVAKKWGITPRRVQQLCKKGQIEGAVKQGRVWVIPESAALGVKNRGGTRTGLLPLPVGISGYVEAVTHYYYIDKTLMIRDFIDALTKVSLFTRPRRFGKTLNMDMLRVFFERSEVDTSVYFKDKAIWACGEYYRSFQGKYPVIYLTFKDVKYGEWKKALKNIAEIIGSEYARHAELGSSEKCNAVERTYYQRIIEGKADDVDLARSLFMLSAMLHKHYGAEAVIIIDEYDTPIQQGYESGYYDEVIAFIRNLFSGAFKDNSNLAFGFMTGILRVAKESIFSGMNNLKVNTIMDDRFSSYFGFTKDEVEAMLAYYGREDKLDEACKWYDGYRFGGSEIFNPWSVINYVDESCTPKAFWQSTGSNEIIGTIISAATDDVTEKLRTLMQGETVTTFIDTGVIYPEIKRDPSSIFSFLLVAGYLKNTEIVPQGDGNYMCKIAIPNKEISYVYAKEIIAKLNPEGMESTAARIRQAVYERDVGELRSGIEDYLIRTISFHDTATEAFYQGLMLGLCAILNNRYSVRSNRESGFGRFDIQLMPLSSELPGLIFELKASKDETEDLDALAKSALKQIAEKQYKEEMAESGIQEILGIGIAFRGKSVRVESDC